MAAQRACHVAHGGLGRAQSHGMLLSDDWALVRLHEVGHQHLQRLRQTAALILNADARRHAPRARSCVNALLRLDGQKAVESATLEAARSST